MPASASCCLLFYVACFPDFLEALVVSSLAVKSSQHARSSLSRVVVVGTKPKDCKELFDGGSGQAQCRRLQGRLCGEEDCTGISMERSECLEMRSMLCEEEEQVAVGSLERQADKARDQRESLEKEDEAQHQKTIAQHAHAAEAEARRLWEQEHDQQQSAAASAAREAERRQAERADAHAAKDQTWDSNTALTTTPTPTIVENVIHGAKAYPAFWLITLAICCLACRSAHDTAAASPDADGAAGGAVSRSPARARSPPRGSGSPPRVQERRGPGRSPSPAAPRSRSRPGAS